jgi:hypothetical protein
MLYMTSAKYRRYACFGIGPTRSTSATRRLVAKNNVGEQRPADHGPLAVADNRQIAGADDLSEFVEDRLAIWWCRPRTMPVIPRSPIPPPPVGDGWERDDGPGEDNEAAVKIEAPAPAPNKIETKVKPMVQHPAYVEPPPRETTFYTEIVNAGELKADLFGRGWSVERVHEHNGQVLCRPRVARAIRGGGQRQTYATQTYATACRSGFRPAYWWPDLPCSRHRVSAARARKRTRHG